MKKLFSFLFVFSLFLTLAGCGGQPSPDTSVSGSSDGNASGAGSQTVNNSDLAYIQDKGTLIIGITEFEPMDYQDENGQWIGFDADMAKAFAKIGRASCRERV